MASVDLHWNPLDQNDPGPCIQVVLMNSPDVIERGRAIGLEYPEPRELRALLDTGASVTVISKKFASYCRLLPTSESSEITALGGTVLCGEHAGAISFPGTNLRSFDLMRIVSADFVKERNYACLIGRDILQYWRITFDGPAKRISITD
jgi:predicted aspartyl protease